MAHSNIALTAQLQHDLMQQQINSMRFVDGRNNDCGVSTANQNPHVAKMQLANAHPNGASANMSGMGNMAALSPFNTYTNIMMNTKNSNKNMEMMRAINVQQPFAGGSIDFTNLAIASHNTDQGQQVQNDIPTFAQTSRNLSFLMTAQQQGALPPTPPQSVSNIFSMGHAEIDFDTEPTPICPSLEMRNKEKRCKSSSKSKDAQATSARAPPQSTNKTKRLLPADWVPTSTSVICANKRKYYESEGNTRFRVVCDMFTRDYANAPTKMDKSAVVSLVMDMLLEDCPDGICFVSPQGGRWYAVSDRTAREKVGTYLRDCLSGQYLSSAKNKIARRKRCKTEVTTVAPASTTVGSSNSSSDDNDQDDDSLGSVSFYDVDDLTPVPL